MAGRLAIAVGVGLGLAWALTGCSTKTKPGLSGSRSPGQRAGSVSLAALSQQNPDWLLVANTDQAIRRYQAMLQTPALVNSQASAVSATSSDLLPPVPKEMLPRDTETQSAQEVHLNSLADREIKRLEESLRTAEDERLAAEKKLADAQAQDEYYAGRKQIDDRFLAVERAIIGGDSGRVVNVIVQIKALRVNARVPQTAPDDYWTKQADAKEAELASLKLATT